MRRFNAPRQSGAHKHTRYILPTILLVMLPTSTGIASSQTPASVQASRSAVPLLCTETQAARTRVRGTGVIADSGGTLLTAAHVIQQAHSNCTLSVLIPDDEWS